MKPSGTHEDLETHRRLRACLEGIRHLDPSGVETRIAEVDREIAALEAVIGGEASPRRADLLPARMPAARRPMEFVSIGSRLAVRAA